MIIVDTSVVLAGLFADGTTRRALLETGQTLVAPGTLRQEVDRNLKRVIERTGMDQHQTRRLLDSILARIDRVAPEVYGHLLAQATEACGEAQAWRDEEYVALAMALQAPIWTLDRDFERVAGIEVVVGRDFGE